MKKLDAIQETPHEERLLVGRVKHKQRHRMLLDLLAQNPTTIAH